MRFLSRLMTLFSIQFTKSMNAFALEFIDNLNYLRKKIYIISIISYILSSLLLFGFVFAIFEMAYQYDQSHFIRATTTLILSSCIAIISFALLVAEYFLIFESKRISRPSKSQSSTQNATQYPTLDLALSQLIIELAKDMEFKRKEAQAKSQAQTNSADFGRGQTTDFKKSQFQNENQQQSPVYEPYIKEAEEAGWAD